MSVRRRSNEGSLHTSAGKVSVIMPAFNEATHILANVEQTVRAFIEMQYDFEIIVVDDGSNDATHLQALRSKALDPQHVRVVRYENNRGKGHALSVGVHHSCGEYVVFLDADMELPPRQLSAFFSILAEHDADAVIGSKFHPDSKVNYPWHRRILSYGYYILVRTLFGLPLRDTQTGLKLFRRRLLQSALPFTTTDGFVFDVELMAVMNVIGARFADAPITLSFKRGAGRIGLRTVLRMFVDTLRVYKRVTIASPMIRHIAHSVRLHDIGEEHEVPLILHYESALLT